MALKTDGRPGAWQTPAGRRVIGLMVLAVIGAFTFLVISNKITGQGASSSASSTQAVTVTGNQTQRVLPDGTVETVSGPMVSPAVPNAFSPGALAARSSADGDVFGSGTTGTESPNPVTTGTKVPQSDPGYRAASAVAQGAAAEYCAWDVSSSADEYAKKIPALTDEYRKNVRDAARAAWPQVQRNASSSTCTPVTAKNVTPVTFDAKRGIAVVDVQMVQDSTAKREKTSRTVSFKVQVVNKKGVWQVDSITG